MEQGDDLDRVRLRVPADPGYARLVRVATAAMALRLDLPREAVADLRLAVDEALVLLLIPVEASWSTNDDVSVEVELRPEGAGMCVVISLDPPEPIAGRENDETWREALSRFHELVPPGVTIARAGADAGLVELCHPG